MNVPLSADLVVLSACETARGRIAPGEGILGLMWAVFVAGSPATLVSQWRVDSASTTKLMVAFHREWNAERRRCCRKRARCRRHRSPCCTAAGSLAAVLLGGIHPGRRRPIATIGPVTASTPASRQNCRSFSSVIRCPFSRSRLISISLIPASLPAACSGFGRPRTTTVVLADGPLWTTAPARFAARIASLRFRRQDAGERDVDAFQRAQHAGLQRGRRIAERLDHLVGALVSLAALADAAIDDLLQVIGAREPADLGQAHAQAARRL